MSSTLITLDVSGRKYRTQKATLQTSPYFRNLLARWEDGSYFVDADPEAFQHILDFMRRPLKFPLFWTKDTGFDYSLYNRLEAEADYFLLHDLRDWLRKKQYLNAVKTIVEVKALSEYQVNNGRNSERCEADMEVQSFFGHYSGHKIYRCPLGIHHDDARDCDRGGCVGIKQRQNHGVHYDDPPKLLTLVIKRIVFDETICVNQTVC